MWKPIKRNTSIQLLKNQKSISPLFTNHVTLDAWTREAVRCDRDGIELGFWIDKETEMDPAAESGEICDDDGFIYRRRRHAGDQASVLSGGGGGEVSG
ncbi:hypothetical protein FCM35_KLT04682 [Carex littledalei]|uniref:Uncharacterized protein n=1 Tax=Carex littledalei TaxID=544730 RepID=A0A833V955_9POAL|nr:hypothetical protein FCM35_KLT04682 [Carex littledalei]